jgi:hypothetical protein
MIEKAGDLDPAQGHRSQSGPRNLLQAEHGTQMQETTTLEMRLALTAPPDLVVARGPVADFGTGDSRGGGSPGRA